MIRTLSQDDFESLYAAFQAAFSDYVVKLSPTKEQFAEMITRRGWAPELSVGAFDGGTMVGFTINGIDGDRAYDAGTGIVPSHRRFGLARKLMERSFELLHGRTEYVLEVIDSNERAIPLYRDLGFREARGLQCWTLPASDDPPADEPETVSLSEFEGERFDVAPSWQNTTASIRRARDPYVVLGDARGYAIVFPGSGDLPQLFVRREARRRGIGTRLLRTAAAVAGRPLRIVNVEDADRGIAAFLERAGAARTVRQLEMVRPL